MKCGALPAIRPHSLLQANEVLEAISGDRMRIVRLSFEDHLANSPARNCEIV